MVGQDVSAASAFAFSATRRPPRRPSSAVMSTVPSQSWMRLARLSGEKPPKTTAWIAPMRAQASMATAALDHHRQIDGDAVALADAETLHGVGAAADLLVQFAVGD